MLKKIFTAIASITILLSIKSCSNEKLKSKYSYKEIVEIFSHTQYINNIEQIKNLVKKYQLNKKNQKNIYFQNIKSINKNPKKWINFIKDSINFYINHKHKYLIKYYSLKSIKKEKPNYNSYQNLKEKSLPKDYYKIYYLDNTGKDILKIEKYINNKKVEIEYYNNNNGFIIYKKTLNKNNSKTQYFQSNEEI